MTNFDLGDPAPDADEEPDDESDSSEETTALESPETTAELDPDPEPTESPTTDPDGENEPDDEQPDPTETGPAFPYSEVKQSPLYAREETWTEFEDQLDFEVIPELRKMGIRDDELREIHDVVLEIALDNLEEIPERLAEKRRVSR